MPSRRRDPLSGTVTWNGVDIAKEPDPEERVRFRNLLSEQSGERIVILSTHIVSDVEATATRIAVVAQGSLVMEAAPEELLRSVEGRVWEWLIPSSELTAVKGRFLVSGTIRRSEWVNVRVVSEVAPGAGARLASPNLEDAYLARGAGAADPSPATRARQAHAGSPGPECGPLRRGAPRRDPPPAEGAALVVVRRSARPPHRPGRESPPRRPAHRAGTFLALADPPLVCHGHPRAEARHRPAPLLVGALAHAAAPGALGCGLPPLPAHWLDRRPQARARRRLHGSSRVAGRRDLHPVARAGSRRRERFEQALRRGLHHALVHRTDAGNARAGAGLPGRAPRACRGDGALYLAISGALGTIAFLARARRMAR